MLQARAGDGNFLNLGVLFCIMGTGLPPSLPSPLPGCDGEDMKPFIQKLFVSC